jgi:hypothetical protein
VELEGSPEQSGMEMDRKWSFSLHCQTIALRLKSVGGQKYYKVHMFSLNFFFTCTNIVLPNREIGVRVSFGHLGGFSLFFSDNIRSTNVYRSGSPAGKWVGSHTQTRTSFPIVVWDVLRILWGVRRECGTLSRIGFLPRLTGINLTNGRRLGYVISLRKFMTKGGRVWVATFLKFCRSGETKAD